MFVTITLTDKTPLPIHWLQATTLCIGHSTGQVKQVISPNGTSPTSCHAVETNRSGKIYTRNCVNSQIEHNIWVSVSRVRLYSDSATVLDFAKHASRITRFSCRVRTWCCGWAHGCRRLYSHHNALLITGKLPSFNHTLKKTMDS